MRSFRRLKDASIAQDANAAQEWSSVSMKGGGRG